MFGRNGSVAGRAAVKFLSSQMYPCWKLRTLRPGVASGLTAIERLWRGRSAATTTWTLSYSPRCAARSTACAENGEGWAAAPKGTFTVAGSTQQRGWASGAGWGS